MSKFKAYTMAAAAALAYTITPDAILAQETQRQAGVSLREVDIRAFIEDVSNATGRTFIIDPRVTGRVSVMAQQTLNERELLDVFMSTLRVNGFIAVPTAQGAYRIVPDAVAAREAAPTSAANGDPSENRYVTRVFPLRYADADGVAAAVRPMLSERGQVTANRRGNTIVVVDYGSTISRLADVVARLDMDTSSFRSVRLTNTAAGEMARVVTSLASGIGDDGQGRSFVQAVPVSSSNTLVLRGDARSLDILEPVVRELDRQADHQAGVQVIPLRFAVAEELVPVLQQLSASLAATPGADGQPSANRRANIASHRATNSLIISADRETQEALSNVVRALDVRRQQVLVEAIIVEVSDNTARELGLQLFAAGDGSNAVPFLSTSYSNSAPNLLALAGAMVTDDDEDAEDSPALSALRDAAVRSLLGSSGALVGIGGQTDDGRLLGLILNALHEDVDSNVLSTPSVMTLDNETASILVGQQIPITTGEALGSNNENPFRTVQREDVGVQLEVRPQISEGGAIRLAIRQEVSSIFGPLFQDSTDLITNRREIETVVQVEPGQIIVLGGLIQAQEDQTVSGVPGLRRVPVVGRLFRSEGRTLQRTNLMVFLRPTIVSTPDRVDQVTLRQYRALQADESLTAPFRRQLEEQMRGVGEGANLSAPALTLQPRAEAPAPERAAAVTSAAGAAQPAAAQ